MRIFVEQKMIKFNVIALTHASIGLKALGHFHIDALDVAPKMRQIKLAHDISEIMYLSTCNRVEFIFINDTPLDEELVRSFLHTVNPDLRKEELEIISKKARYWNGINAVNHLIEVASSLDSMVLGEREIITQVRNAHDFSQREGLSGDTIRIVMRHTIETAKKVFTETIIAEKSVSVVSLAYQEFRKANLPKKAKILIIGSGVTNQNMCKFLTKDGYTQFTVFNRTLTNAEKFVETFGGKAEPLKNLELHDGGFDAIISCTGSNSAVLTQKIYTSILKDNKTKHIIDLAIPNDVAETIPKAFPVNYISVASLKKIADKNLLIRRKELLKVREIIYNSLEDFKSIFEMRQIELKMQAIPQHVKEIRTKALTEVFHKEVSKLDDETKAVLDKILNYMEKKYVSVPMIMAKEMLTKIK
jgi:glutamyl-tRNA reductase